MISARRAALIAPLLASLAWIPMLVPTNVQAAATTQQRSVAEFQAVSLNGAMDLLVRQGAQQTLEVQADAADLPLLETVVESSTNGPTLVVRWKKEVGSWWSSSRSKVLVTVVLPKLSAVSAAGSGDIRVEAFTTPALKVSLSGSGDARLSELTTSDLGIRISGSGDVSATGSATKLAVNIAGSGDVRLAELRADDVDVRIAGSGDAAVNAQKTLAIRIAGSGDVTYTGNPSVKSSVAGSGSVTRK